jgi:superfamily II DNA or RNA helicase
MARTPTLSYDRGTLILHPPPRGKSWVDYAEWDDRVERFRLPAFSYRSVVSALRTEGTAINDEARAFKEINTCATRHVVPYPHQSAAVQAWKTAGRRGVVVLPTGAGKTLVAQLAMQCTPRSTLIVVPTLDLMHQWYAGLLETFGADTAVGLLGGGSRDDDSPILVATYASAAINAERLGNRYALLIFDEVHHLPADFTRVIADYSIAPYRLGLTATLTREDGRDRDLETLVGPVVYRRTPEELAGQALAPYDEVQIRVSLTAMERGRYRELITRRNDFLRSERIRLGTIQGWQQFVRASGTSAAGRAAMLAHREARAVAFGTAAKLDVLEHLLDQHAGERTLIFTDDTATVYRVASELLLPAITHLTPIKERHETLAHFRAGTYPVLITSRVLNEGVDVPEASVAVVLSGTGTEREYTQRLGRILRRVTGKRATLYEIIAEHTSEEGVSTRRRSVRYNSPEEEDDAKANTTPPIDGSSPAADDGFFRWEEG